MKFYFASVVIAMVCMGYTFSFYTPHDALPEVPYPEGYRKWTHVKTGLIASEQNPVKGYHHIYANAKAMEGYESGTFPEGSIIVFDVLEDVKMPNGNIAEGKRRMVDVMVKDKKFESTGGWGFEEFAGDSFTQRTIQGLATVKCFNCHAQKKNNDFVFSTFRK